MTTTMPTPARDPHEGRLALREEDLEVGRRFVHPETRLEYEDFHAYFLGKDPIPHWRNARIKEISRWRDSGRRYVHPVEGTGDYSHSEYAARCIDQLFTCFDRDGRHLYAAADDPRIRAGF